MANKKVIIIGAGPGGLASAMLLAKQGFEVNMYEKKSYVGGRTSSIRVGDFTFDLGPTFFSMPHILEEIFASCERKLEDYVDLIHLNPMYSLKFDDFTLRATSNREEMAKRIEEYFPGEGENYKRFMDDTRKKMERLTPMLQNSHSSLFDYIRLRSLKALPELEIGKSLYDVLSKYFKDERLKLSFTFQSKYLGMSPWDCPGAFSILSFMEHEYGIIHPKGGLNQLTKAMAKVVEELGGKIHLNSGIKKILFDGKRATGITLENGEQLVADEIIMNADFARGMIQLTEDATRKKYSNNRLAKKKYSCSTFMIYLGLNQKVDLDHHTVFFSNDYRKNVEEIMKTNQLSIDPSIYVQNASVTDDSLAPEGKSALYILAPVPNNFSEIDWEREKVRFRELVLSLVMKKTGIEELEAMIEAEHILTPKDWEDNIDVYKGATFNLSHHLGQMMYFRPHNEFEEFKHLWLVGGGTHPGSGLPTIFESARITVKKLSESYGMKEGPI